MSLLKKFWFDESGQFATIFAVSSFVLVSAIGLAVNFTNRNTDNAFAHDVLDSAVLATASAFQQGKTKAQAIQIGQDYFHDNCVEDSVCATNKFRRTANITFGASDTNVTGTFQSTVDNSFATMAGISSLDVNLTSVAEFAMVSANDATLNVVVDVSGSMNIADGISNINRMKPLFFPRNQVTPNEPNSLECAFACHIDDYANVDIYNGLSGLAIARNNSIKLREDTVQAYVRDEIPRFLSRSDIKQVSFFEISDISKRVSQPTGDPRRARQDAMSVMPSSRTTKFGVAIPQLHDLLKGSGRSASGQAVLLITDGMNHANDAVDNMYPQAMDPADCEALKRDGVSVIVLNLLYPDPSIISSVTILNAGRAANVYDDVQTNLKKCASDSLYFVADWSSSVRDALRRISNAPSLVGTTQTVRLAR